jgi:hypothetical protein
MRKCAKNEIFVHLHGLKWLNLVFFPYKNVSKIIFL